MAKVVYTKRDTYYLGKWPIFSKKSQYAEHSSNKEDDEDNFNIELTERIIEV